VRSVCGAGLVRGNGAWATLEKVRKHGHALTPDRHVGAEAQKDDGEPFPEKMQRLVAELHKQQAEAARLDAAIAANLRELGFAQGRALRCP